MQAFANQPFLEKRRKLARWCNYIGLGALFGGLFLASRSPAISSGLLLVGVFAASMGAFMANRYVREPRPDQLLSRALDGLDKRYTLLSYYLPTEHVLFSHDGFTAIIARSQQGTIRCAQGRWTHKQRGRWFKQLMGEPSLANPMQDLARERQDLQRWATSQQLGDVPINGLVVFTGKDVVLELKDPSVPAVTLSHLADYVREGSTAAPLTTSQRREIENKLHALVGNH
ncbi:MAG: hypothetical protein ACOX2L_07760 [Anaerolineae bacterium]|jgi:hypothetical protein|nr:hypothetical protein [Chloroflexota bacterium]